MNNEFYKRRKEKEKRRGKIQALPRQNQRNSSDAISQRLICNS